VNGDEPTMMPEEFAAEMKQLVEDFQPVRFEVSKIQGFAVLAAIQLALRHPDFKGPLSAEVSLVARGLANAFTQLHPGLRSVIEDGFRVPAAPPVIILPT